MSARFRIRTSQGQEISFASHEMFAEFVRSGDLSPDDVVYDAETREWSSARTHPVVLQIELEAEEQTETATVEGDAPASESPAGETSPETPEESSDIGLDLAPAPDEMTPEEEAAAFVKKMEAERASDLEYEEEPSFEGFTMEHGSSGLLSGISPAPEEAPPAPARPEKKDEPPRAAPRRDAPTRKEARREEPMREEPRREAPTRKKTKKPKKTEKPRKSGAGRRYAPLIIVLVVVVGAAVLVAPRLFSSGDEGGEAAPEDVVLPPPPPPLIPDTEDALRERAQERFLTTTRALLQDLPTIPDIWLRGAYLAAPSDYPQVREAWNQYLTIVRQVREGDNERYRAAYTRALDDAQVTGTGRTLRLANAVSDFQGSVAPRAAHYDRVEALALAALQGHDALVEAEGTIAYEPASTTPVSGDPVIEAVGRDPQAQALLDDVLDTILERLQAPDGPGQASNLSEWVWDGLLDAVTN